MEIQLIMWSSFLQNSCLLDSYGIFSVLPFDTAFSMTTRGQKSFYFCPLNGNFKWGSTQYVLYLSSHSLEGFALFGEFLQLQNSWSCFSWPQAYIRSKVKFERTQNCNKSKQTNLTNTNTQKQPWHTEYIWIFFFEKSILCF